MLQQKLIQYLINLIYFSKPNTTYRNIPSTEIGKTAQDFTGLVGSLIGIDRKPKINSKPSDLMIKYTGNGNLSSLYNSLSYSKYRPNYTTRARSQNTSILFNFNNKS